jgi:hypothetical protein
MAFSGTKSVFKSLTIQGAVVAIIPSLLKLGGLDLGADGAGLVSNLIDSGMTFFGAAVAVYGRIRATQELHL